MKSEQSKAGIKKIKEIFDGKSQNGNKGINRNNHSVGYTSNRKSRFRMTMNDDERISRNVILYV